MNREFFSKDTLSELIKILADKFNKSELQSLCFALDIDYENLSGETKTDKARELVLYCVRREFIYELVEKGQQLRPDIDWSIFRKSSPLNVPHIPNNLPQRDEFIGRQSEKDNVHAALRSRSRLISISGIGGIGKTALALEVAYECLQNSQIEPTTGNTAAFEGVVWIDTQRIDLSLGELLNTVAETLHYPGIMQRSPDEKIRNIRDLLRSKPYLLIVDGFDTITDHRILEFLRNDLVEPSKALITAREVKFLEKAWVIPLERLSESEGIEMIRMSGRRLSLTAVECANDEELLPLYKATGGAPLAIQWAVGQMRGAGQSLNAVIKDLQGARADIFARIFDRSWRFLTGAARRILMVMPLFASPAIWESVRAASDLPKPAFDSAKKQLVEMSLLNFTDQLGEPRFYIHPLTRAFTTAREESEEEFVQKAFERLLEYYKQLVIPPAEMRLLVTPPAEMRRGELYWDGVNWEPAGLQEELENLVLLIRRALDQGYDAQALELFLPIVHFLNAQGFWDERLQLSYEIAKAANRLQDPAEAWLWIDAIGFILSEQQRIREFCEALENGRKVARQLGVTDALILANAFEAWSHFYRDEHNIELARKRIKSAKEKIDWGSIYDSAPISKLIAARVASSAATWHKLQRDFAGAKEWLEYALDLRISLGENITSTLLRLARSSLRLDDELSAEKYLQKKIEPRPRDLASLSYTRALLAERKGQLEEAESLAEQALEQYTRFGYKGGEKRYKELLYRLHKRMIKSPTCDPKKKSV